MKRYFFPVTLTLALLVFTGCDQEDSLLTPVDPAREAAGAAKKGQKGNVDTDSRASYTFHADVPHALDQEGHVTASVGALIRSDGHGAYIGDECGVDGKIFWYNPDKSQSGDAVLDPDKNKDRKCPHYPRQIVINGLPVGPFVNINNIMNEAAGNPSGPERVVFQGLEGSLTSNTGATCDRIRFNDALWNEKSASNKDEDQAGQWVVQSNPDSGHMADCIVWQKGNYIQDGTVEAPFHVTVDEIFVAE